MTSILSSKEARALISNGAQIIDVRTHTEFRQDAVQGAINLPLHDIHNGLAAELDNKKPVLVYCRTGGRSARAIELLKGQGFKAVYNAGSLSNLI